MTGERKKEKTKMRNKNLKLPQKWKIKQLPNNEIVFWLPEPVEEPNEGFFAGMLASSSGFIDEPSKSFLVGGSSRYVSSCHLAPTTALP